jgi:hypothetical protein
MFVSKYRHASIGFLLILALVGLCNGRRKVPSITSQPTTRQQGGCRYDFSFTATGQTANLDSPNYPNDYPPNVDCKYFLTSPVGTQMMMQCNDFNVESSNNCQNDMFYMSLTGNPAFSDQTFACGKGTLEKTSVSNKFAIGFRSDDSNPPNSPYRFRCQITVIGNPAPPPTPSCSCGFRNEVSGSSC